MLRDCVMVLTFALVTLSPTTPSSADVTASPAPNQLYGHLTSDQTLTYASPGPTYEIIGDFTIDPGVTLTIEGNVNVRVTGSSDYLASGLDRSKVEFVVNGTLHVPLGSAPVQIGSTQDGLRDSWHGIDVGAGGIASLYNTSLKDCIDGVHVRGAGTATFNTCVIANCARGLLIDGAGSASMTNGRIDLCEVGAFIQSGGTLAAVRTTVTRGHHGLLYEPGALGDVRACTMLGPSGGEGLRLPFSPSPADSVLPAPTQITSFSFGIRTVAPNVRLDHMIINGCTYAVHDDLGGHALNYCTLSDNVYNTWGIGVGVIYNSILVSGGFYPTTNAINYVDWWGIAGSAWEAVALGDVRSSFDPYFVSGDATFHLHPASLFTNFSVSGGQIGAYGPGPVGPTPILAASVVDAEGRDGVVRVRWLSQATANSKAGIVRRTADGEWQPLTVLYPDGLGYVSLEDRDVTAGERYGYGVGVQRDGHVGIQGEVWVTVETPINGLAFASIGPNPATVGWSVTFDSAETAYSQIEIVDLSGRLVRTLGVGMVGRGRQTVYLPASGLSAGVYWIRVRQGSRSVRGKAVKTN